MKRISLLAAVVAGLSLGVSGANAQSPQPTVNWTGFYIGGHGGYQWSSVDLSWEYDLPGLGNGADLNTDGGMGGVHGGIQQQFGNWVLGVELSGDWGDGGGTERGSWEFALPEEGITCSQFFGCTGLEASGNPSIGVSLDSLFLATGRLAYAWDNVLFFAKGGFASAEMSTVGKADGGATLCLFQPLNTCPTASWSGSETAEKRHTGYALGAGFDWMVWRNVSFGVDYTYVNLGSETHTGTFNGEVTLCGDCGFDFSTKYKIDVDPEDIHYVNARLTVHFNGLSP